jgi:type II secretion system protein H
VVPIALTAVKEKPRTLEIGNMECDRINLPQREQSRPAGRKRALGFTLLELMVVVVVIGIVTAVILPAMKGTYEDALLRSTGRKLITVCSLAYSQAITGNRLHRVRLDAKNGRYAVERRASQGEPGVGFVPVRNVPGGEGDLDQRIALEFHRPDEEPSAEPGGAIPPAEADGPKPSGDVILFYPDGTADEGEIQLRDREGFTLTLRMNPTTARLRIVDKARE